jgi:hypothetical protein
MIDQHSSDRRRGESEEVGLVVESDVILMDEAEVGLVDQGRRLEGVVRPFLAKERRCHSMEVLVQDFEQAICGTGITLAHAAE